MSCQKLEAPEVRYALVYIDFLAKKKCLDADIDEEIPRLRNVFLSKLVWDDDGDLAKRVDRQLIQYQRMAYKPRNRWSHKITVPQPFEMTIREYTRPKSESYSSKRIAKLLEERYCNSIIPVIYGSIIILNGDVKSNESVLYTERVSSYSLQELYRKPDFFRF